MTNMMLAGCLAMWVSGTTETTQTSAEIALLDFVTESKGTIEWDSDTFPKRTMKSVAYYTPISTKQVKTLVELLQATDFEKQTSLHFANTSELNLEGVKHLAKLKRLKSIYLPVEFQKGEIEILKTMVGLTDLSIFEAFEPTDLKFLAELPNLKSVKILGKNAVTIEHLRELRKIKTLRELEVTHHESTPDMWKEISQFKQLTKLTLWADTPKGAMEEVAKMNNLAELWIMEFEDPVAGMESVCKMTNLKRLFLRDENLIDAHFAKIAELKKLEDIGICSEKVTTITFKEVSKLKSLIRLHHQKPTDAIMVEIGKLTNLKTFTFDAGSLSEKGYEELAKLTNLEAIYTWCADISVESAQSIGLLTKLKNLTLIGCQVDQGVAREIGRLTNLQNLRCDETFAKDENTLKEFANLVNLRSLALSHVDSADLKYLRKMKNLTSLTIRSSRINDQGMNELAKFTQLRVLDLTGSNTEDDDLKKLRQLPKLEWLYLGRTQIDDDGLKTLSMFPSLRYVRVNETGCTPEGIAEVNKCTKGFRAE